jgi:hypothetical protein
VNNVNELWTSAWRQLQKDLASSFAAGDGLGEALFASPVSGRSVSSSSWLVRARSLQQPTIGSIQ